MTLVEYYKSFGKLAKAIAIFLAALPFLNHLLPDDLAGYAFPPIGPFTPIAQILTVTFGFFATLAAYFAPRGNPFRNLAIASVMFAGLCRVIWLVIFGIRAEGGN